MVRRLNLQLPRRGLDQWGACWSGAPPGRDRADRRRGQVHRPAGRLPVGDRGPAGRRLRQQHPGEDRLGRLRRLHHPGRCRRRAGRRAGGADPGRVRGPRHRGQDRRDHLRPDQPDPDAGPVPGPAVHGDRGGPQPGRAGRGELRRVRRERRRPGDRHHGRPARRGRRRQGHGRHDAAGCLPGAADAGLAGRRDLRQHQVSERHRHRYEVNNAYRDKLEAAGLHLSGTSPDSSLVEFVELDRELHPFLVATQAHPEFKSRPTRPHPLFAAFVRAALDYLESERLPTAPSDPGTALDSWWPASAWWPGAAPPVPAAERRAADDDPEQDFSVVSSEAGLRRPSRVGAGRRGRDARWRDRQAGGRRTRRRGVVVRGGSAAGFDAENREHGARSSSTGMPLGRRLWELPAGLLDVDGSRPSWPPPGN